ncbi:MAG: hypothetical protein ACI92S_002604, partial [Planctomycetaceae bacterium]
MTRKRPGGEMPEALRPAAHCSTENQFGKCSRSVSENDEGVSGKALAAGKTLN